MRKWITEFLADYNRALKRGLSVDEFAKERGVDARSIRRRLRSIRCEFHIEPPRLIGKPLVRYTPQNFFSVYQKQKIHHHSSSEQHSYRTNFLAFLKAPSCV